jgi:transcriptional regulator with XRE-family HTH domain
MSINERIALLRKMKGLSQAELGKALNVTDKAVSKWENGDGTPDMTQIMSLCSYFNISIDYLMTGSVLSEGDKAIEKEINAYQKALALNASAKDAVTACKKYLDGLAISYDEGILPRIVDDGIDMNCFKKNSDGSLGVIYERLVAKKAKDVLKRLCSNEIQLLDATELDDWDLFEMGMANAKKDIEAVKNLPTDEIHPSIFGLKDEEKAHNIEVNRRKRAEGVYNLALEELDPRLENYYRFIIALIDEGAYYSNLVYPDRTNLFVPGSPSFEKDQAKTSFFYRVAKDMLALSEKKEPASNK